MRRRLSWSSATPPDACLPSQEPHCSSGEVANTRQICTFFAMGGCSRGDRCKYSHELRQEAPAGVDVSAGYFISGNVANYRGDSSTTTSTAGSPTMRGDCIGLNPKAQAFKTLGEKSAPGEAVKNTPASTFSSVGEMQGSSSIPVTGSSTSSQLSTVDRYFSPSSGDRSSVDALLTQPLVTTPHNSQPTSSSSCAVAMEGAKLHYLSHAAFPSPPSTNLPTDATSNRLVNHATGRSGKDGCLQQVSMLPMARLPPPPTSPSVGTPTPSLYSEDLRCGPRTSQRATPPPSYRDVAEAASLSPAACPSLNPIAGVVQVHPGQQAWPSTSVGNQLVAIDLNAHAALAARQRAQPPLPPPPPPPLQPSSMVVVPSHMLNAGQTTTSVVGAPQFSSGVAVTSSYAPMMGVPQFYSTVPTTTVGGATAVFMPTAQNTAIPCTTPAASFALAPNTQNDLRYVSTTAGQKYILVNSGLGILQPVSVASAGGGSIAYHSVPMPY